MTDALFWLKVVLLFGGMFVALAGMLWEKAARPIWFLCGIDVRPETAEKVALAGALAFFGGLAWLYLDR